MGKYFSEVRKFGGKSYDLQYTADTKREASDYIKRHTSGRYARIVPNTMIGGRKVYLVYTRFK